MDKAKEGDDRILEGISADDIEVLKELGVAAVVSLRDKHGSSAMHYAAGYGAVQTCQWLLDCGFDATIACPHKGRTPLHWAARNGHDEICRLLILGKSHCKVDVQAKGQVTPLQLAVWQGRLDTCRLLVSLGADPRFINGESFFQSSLWRHDGGRPHNHTDIENS